MRAQTVIKVDIAKRAARHARIGSRIPNRLDTGTLPRLGPSHASASELIPSSRSSGGITSA